jgi:hypothetical protein
MNRWLYAGGRPNWLARQVNHAWAALFARGAGPDQASTLEVQGRNSGQPIRLPIVVADYQGGRYLVSMLGTGAGWVANVKAAGGEAVLHHGNSKPIRLIEVPPRERAPILRRYLELAPGARPHFPVRKDAPLTEFEKIAVRYPVFRIRSRAAAPPAAHNGGAGRTYSRRDHGKTPSSKHRSRVRGEPPPLAPRVLP